MKILSEKCKRCLACIEICPVQAIFDRENVVEIDQDICIECGCCAATCPNEAVSYEN